MSRPYTPQEIEPKWQEKWEADQLYRSVIDPQTPKFYALTMLPYPSGDLHIGHWYAMTPSDVRARFKRMQGYNVLFPMGFDAFGLPAENAAIQRGIHPKTWTLANVETMRRQMRSMGTMFDWEREAVSCLPGYYRWSEWFFLKFYEMGLAYRKKSPVDYCPACKTTLAREQVVGEERICERCGTAVVKKDLEQWFWRITKYADELLDFSKIDWPEKIRLLQTNWIGRSEGAEVTFSIDPADLPADAAESEGDLVVFTTRPDTLWGATFMVLAPEHPLVERIVKPDRREEVVAYRQAASRQTEIERMSTEKEKTGVFTGAYAINPVNGARIPVWIADYVMMTYGTGAIMAVPAHDERDFAFAIKFGLPIIPVIDRTDGVARSVALRGGLKYGFSRALSEAHISFKEEHDTLYVTLDAAQVDEYIRLVQAYLQPDHWVDVVGARWLFIFADKVIPFDSLDAETEILTRCKAMAETVQSKRTVMEMLWSLPFYRNVLFHHDYGPMINSGDLTGTPGDVAVARVTAWLEEQGRGKAAVNYRLRDWLISRQRYWGSPIPIIYCDKCGIVPVPYAELPVLLPDDIEFMPTGESPLNTHADFLHTTCPQCDGPARRETDTMDTFVCSSWYQYAYLSPYYREGEPVDGDATPWDPAELQYWAPVDTYTGGAEHAVMHLMYTRFFTKALRDAGLLDFDEPMLQYRSQGIILGEPRPGDCAEIVGTWAGNAFKAQSVKVYSFEDQENWPSAGYDDTRVCGEVMDRDDVSIKVQAGEDLIVVHVPEGMAIDIPGKEGAGELADILYQLEVEKMSKSRKNVVAPDALVAEYGADTVRAYLMFGWRWELGGPWDSQGIEGVVRWIHRVWNLFTEEPRKKKRASAAQKREVQRAQHYAVKAVTADMEAFSFNTIIARLMELTNALTKHKDALWGSKLWKEATNTLLLLLAPVTPHLAEELWEMAGQPYSIHQQAWPTWDEAKLKEEKLEIPVQVNGKVRGRVTVAADAAEDAIREAALADENVQRHLEGKQVVKVIVPGGKLVSIVVK